MARTYQWENPRPVWTDLWGEDQREPDFRPLDYEDESEEILRNLSPLLDADPDAPLPEDLPLWFGIFLALMTQHRQTFSEDSDALELGVYYWFGRGHDPATHDAAMQHVQTELLRSVLPYLPPSSED